MADKEKKYSDIDLSKYASGFQGSDVLTQAGTLKQNAVDAYQNFANAGFSSEKQGMADSILNQYLNRDKFSYDFNADALYQQYKDKYIQQGKMAMQDTMGQAAAMTGGYGNSYAASVGNQAYQAHLQNLNDVIPELYQMAYDKYNQEGQDMLNQYGLLGDAIDREYGMWGDQLGILMSDRDYYGQEESNLYNREYGTWNDNRNYDTNQYWNETNFGYQFEQDDVANILANREMAIREAQNRREQEKWDLEKKDLESGGTGGGNGGSGGSGGGNDVVYSTHGYTTDQIKKLQKAAGITVDGVWGAETEKAWQNGWRWHGHKNAVNLPFADEMNDFIKSGASISEISTFLRKAWKEGKITDSQYEELKKNYVPRSSSGGGKGGHYTY
jgi:hypothetical protein